MPAIWHALPKFNTARFPSLNGSLLPSRKSLPSFQKDGVMLKEEVDEEDVAEVVAKWTGIPVSKMLEGEMQKLVTMEERLGKRVIGQEEALDGGCRCSPARARGFAGSESADRLIHFSWPNRRR